MAGWCSGDWKFLLEWNILSFQTNIIVTYTNNKQRSFNIFYLLLCRCGLHFFPKNYVTSMVYWIKSVPCLRIIKKNLFQDMKTVRHNVSLSFLSFMSSMYRKILLCKYPLLAVVVCLLYLANMVSQKTKSFAFVKYHESPLQTKYQEKII